MRAEKRPTDEPGATTGMARTRRHAFPRAGLGAAGLAAASLLGLGCTSGASATATTAPVRIRATPLVAAPENASLVGVKSRVTNLSSVRVTPVCVVHVRTPDGAGTGSGTFSTASLPPGDSQEGYLYITVSHHLAEDVRLSGVTISCTAR